MATPDPACPDYPNECMHPWVHYTKADANRTERKFAQHAAPEAIAAELRNAQTQAARWQRRVAWLTELAETRKAEIEAGTWPG